MQTSAWMSIQHRIAENQVRYSKIHLNSQKSFFFLLLLLQVFKVLSCQGFKPKSDMAVNRTLPKFLSSETNRTYSYIMLFRNYKPLNIGLLEQTVHPGWVEELHLLNHARRRTMGIKMVGALARFEVLIFIARPGERVGTT